MISTALPPLALHCPPFSRLLTLFSPLFSVSPAPASAPAPAPPAPVRASQPPTPITPPSSSPNAALSPELKSKLQGSMALVLKHSGALPKMPGPLEGAELDLMGRALREVGTALRQETEAAVGATIEDYLAKNGDTRGDRPSTPPQAAASPRPAAPAVPAVAQAPVSPQSAGQGSSSSSSSYAEMLAQARARKAAQQQQGR